jgi:hypothetical protein
MNHKAVRVWLLFVRTNHPEITHYVPVLNQQILKKIVIYLTIRFVINLGGTMKIANQSSRLYVSFTQ